MCDAKQYSDQMLCDRCGVQWDVNDPDPPECLKTESDKTPEEHIKTILALLDE